MLQIAQPNYDVYKYIHHSKMELHAKYYDEVHELTKRVGDVSKSQRNGTDEIAISYLYEGGG